MRTPTRGPFVGADRSGRRVGRTRRPEGARRSFSTMSLLPPAAAGRSFERASDDGDAHPPFFRRVRGVGYVAWFKTAARLFSAADARAHGGRRVGGGRGAVDDDARESSRVLPSSFLFAIPIPPPIPLPPWAAVVASATAAVINLRLFSTAAPYEARHAANKASATRTPRSSGRGSTCARSAGRNRDAAPPAGNRARCARRALQLSPRGVRQRARLMFRTRTRSRTSRSARRVGTRRPSWRARARTSVCGAPRSPVPRRGVRREEEKTREEGNAAKDTRRRFDVRIRIRIVRIVRRRRVDARGADRRGVAAGAAGGRAARRRRRARALGPPGPGDGRTGGFLFGRGGGLRVRGDDNNSAPSSSSFSSAPSGGYLPSGGPSLGSTALAAGVRVPSDGGRGRPPTRDGGSRGGARRGRRARRRRGDVPPRVARAR